MVHGDAVAHADGVYLQRGAAGHVDARLDGVGNLLEVEVARDDLVLGGDQGHERAVELLVGEAVGLQEASVRARGPGPALMASLRSCMFFSAFLLRWRVARVA